MQISPRIHALRLPFRIPLPNGTVLDRFVYVYLVYGRGITLIDTGVKGAEEQIFSYIRSTCRNPDEIERIILTHSHPDHIGAAREIWRHTQCEIAAHPAERDWIEDTDLQMRERPVPAFPVLVGGSVSVDTLLPDGARIHAEEAGTFRIFHTPGHSAGSISVLLEEEGALFSGDTILIPGDIPIYDDPRLLISSVRKLRGIPDICRLLSAWDEPRMGAEVHHRMDECIAYIDRIDSVVKETVRAEKDISPQDLTVKVLGSLGIPVTAANPLVTRSLLAHLK